MSRKPLSLKEEQSANSNFLLIHPLVLGTGRRLLAEGSPTTALRLADTKTTSADVVIATYQPASA